MPEGIDSNTRQPTTGAGGRIFTDQGDRDPITGQRYGNAIPAREMAKASGRKSRKSVRK